LSRKSCEKNDKIKSQKEKRRKNIAKRKENIMGYIKVTKDNFDEVKASEKNVLIDFYADWCGPCRMVGPIIEKIADEHPEYVIGKVNVDEEGELAKEFGVMSIPTLVVLKGGEVANRIVGSRNEAQILELLNV
jgi:thioredoxin 1